MLDDKMKFRFFSLILLCIITFELSQVSPRKTYLVKEMIIRQNKLRVKEGELEPKEIPLSDINNFEQVQPDVGGQWCFVWPDGNDFFCVFGYQHAGIGTEMQPFVTTTAYYEIAIDVYLDIILQWWTEWRQARLHDSLVRFEIPELKTGIRLQVMIWKD